MPQYQNSSTLGTNYYIGKPTQKAVDNSEYKNSGLNTSSYWYYWLRSPNANSSLGYFVRNVTSDGSVYYYYAYDFRNMGARPAFYLDLQSAIFKSGTGTENDPFVVKS